MRGTKKSIDSSVETRGDIIDLIMEDHRPLKELIEKMKDPEVDPGDKMVAFEEFASTLMMHSKPEEQALYSFLKEDDELRHEGIEGEIEHALADQLIVEIKSERDLDIWQAKVKILAEMVEHHIQEEEDQMLPEFKRNSSAEEREELGEKFLELKSTIPFDDLYMQVQRTAERTKPSRH